jgi:hypothetical protein
MQVYVVLLHKRIPDTGQVKTTITGVFKEKGHLEENIKLYDVPDSWFTLETWEVIE